MSPLGGISFQVDQEGLYHMAFETDRHESDQHPYVDQVKDALDLYFKHQMHDFHLDVHFQTGTPFEREVWQVLLSIPYGKTMYYQEVATHIGRPKAVRAVGQACKKNPIGIVVPCHRVIGKDGSMTGYSGKQYVDLKAKLLAHERMMTHE